MTEEPEFELVEGTGNVFRDLGDPDADLKHAKALLAADIISALDDSGLSVRKAGEATGFAAADYSRVRNANLGRFTIDRLMRMLGALHRAAGTAAPMPWRAPPISAPNSTAPTAIVVDKSYVQGAGSLAEIQRNWSLLFPDAFFFEVASSNPSARQSCLSKLRKLRGNGGVYVVSNVGELFRKEIHDLVCAGQPSENLVQGLDLDAFFSAQFDDLTKARRDALALTEIEFDQEVDALIEKANTLHVHIQGTTNGSTEQRKRAYGLARQEVAQDRDFIVKFFAEVLCGGAYAPPGARFLMQVAQTGAFGPEWALYRWTQVTLLYALELLEKHGQLAPDKLTTKLREKLQHDVIDMQYVVLGVLQGALASKDKRMRATFKLLRPDGAVLPSDLAS
ncbi:MAG: helix-turn-helix transcriptional regulator [Gammaproteobacteria bacterium]|nr:helix-turn-helix transcriptional regulator [Gammaproteobacteria bacterium]